MGDGDNVKYLAEQKAEEVRLEEIASKLTDKQRKFVEIYKLGQVHPRVAMKEAGYAQKTIDHEGPIVLLRNEKVKAYIEALSDTKLEAIVGSIKAQFLRLEYSVAIALKTVTDLARDAQDEGVKLRAAKAILDLSKGILIATIPQKRMDFSLLMRDIYKEAVDERNKVSDEQEPFLELEATLEEEDPTDNAASA